MAFKIHNPGDFLSQISVRNSLESKLPNLHSCNALWVDCGGVFLAAMLVLRGEFIFYIHFHPLCILTIAVYYYVTSLEIDDPLFLYLFWMRKPNTLVASMFLLWCNIRYGTNHFCFWYDYYPFVQKCLLSCRITYLDALMWNEKSYKYKLK